MHPVYLFIGQSGSGKGTQITLLKEALLKKDPTTTFFAIETGDRFRELIKSDRYTARLTRALMDEGKLPPAFLGVHMWSHDLIEHYDGTTTVIIDGTPRMPDEVPLLLSAAALYGWTINVIYLHTSDKWAYDRMRGRGRSDDLDERETTERIHWFHTSVEPCLDMLRQSPLVRLHGIEGEQSIEKVHSDICIELGIA